MHTIQRIVIAVLCAAALSSQAAAADPGAGGVPDAAQRRTLERLGFTVFSEPVALPPFALKALSGQDLTPESLKGTVTLFNFWATWCPPCQREMPSIGRLGAAMKGTAFRIAAVSTGESRRTVEDFIRKNGYAFPVYLDERGTLGASFAAQGIPSTYILDKSARVVAGVVGSREYDDAALIAVLKEMASR